MGDIYQDLLIISILAIIAFTLLGILITKNHFTHKRNKFIEADWRENTALITVMLQMVHARGMDPQAFLDEARRRIADPENKGGKKE